MPRYWMRKDGITTYLTTWLKEFSRRPRGTLPLANNALARIYGYGTPEELMQNLTDIGRRLYVQEGRRDDFVD